MEIKDETAQIALQEAPEIVPDAPVIAPATPEPRRVKPQLVAWAVLLSAFLIFCTVAWFITSTVADWLSQSVEYRTATVQRAGEPDGSVSVLRKGQPNPFLINGDETVKEGDEIRTDKTSEAVLLLFDNSRVELAPGTRVRLSESRVNVKNFRRTEKRLVVQVLDGQIRFSPAPFVPAREFNRSTIMATLNRESDNVPLVEVMFNDPTTGNYVEGTYIFNVTRAGESGVRAWLSNKGRRVLDIKAANRTVTLQPGLRVAFENNALGEPGSPSEQLVYNGSFINGVDHWKPQIEQGSDGGRIDGQIQFGYERIDDGAQPRTRIVRLDPAGEGNFAETSLVQQLDRDVTEYEELWFSLKMFVNQQSLPGGGQQGFEYPLFVKVQYSDKAGNLYEFFRGFYFKPPDGQSLVQDVTGVSTKLPQAEWTEKRWNLMELRNKPARIHKVVVGSAGHLYESFFTDVNLVGR
jgi:hypothetical protein